MLDANLNRNPCYNVASKLKLRYQTQYPNKVGNSTFSAVVFGKEDKYEGIAEVEPMRFGDSLSVCRIFPFLIFQNNSFMLSAFNFASNTMNLEGLEDTQEARVVLGRASNNSYVNFLPSKLSASIIS